MKTSLADALFENAPYGLAILDSTFSMLRANRELLRMTGTPDVATAGRLGLLNSLPLGRLKEGAPVAGEVSLDLDRLRQADPAITSGTGVITLETQVTPLADPLPGQDSFLLRAHDVTDHRRLARTLQSLLVLTNMQKQPLDTLTEYIVNELKVITGSLYTTFAFVEERDSTFVTTIFAWSKEVMKECQNSQRPQCFKVMPDGIWADAIRHGKTAVDNDYGRSLGTGRLPEGHVPITRVAIIPILSFGRVVAVAGVANKSTPYTDQDMRHAESFLTGATAVTERKQLEMQLAAEKELLTVTLRSIGDGVITTDIDGRVTSLNSLAETLTGWSASEAQGRPLQEVLRTRAESPQPEDQDPLPLVLENGVLSRSRECLLVTRSGDERTIEEVAASIKDRQDRIIGAVLVFRDITGQRRLQAQLQQAQKLEVIGRLAGGVAHDFNNLLTPILGYSAMTMELASERDPVHENARLVHEAAERAARLTRHLLAFSRNQILQTRPLNLVKEINSLGKMLKMLIRENIVLEFDLEPGTPVVRGDPAQFQQVMMNLVLNAQDAQPDGGSIKIRTCTVRFEENVVGLPQGLKPGTYAMVSVSDEGHGMEPGTLSRIFEPFFTTKEPGKGTGLGLAMVYGNVRQHGGHISVESRVGVGSTFKIYLPESPVTQVPEEETPVAGPLPQTSGRVILLIEDHDMIRRLIVKMLIRKGFQVLEAASPAEALDLVARHKGTIDLLLTDLVMPGMSGLEAREKLRSSHPGLHTIFMSGYTSDTALQEGLLEKGALFLEKPFTEQALMDRIHKCLAKPPVPADLHDNPPA